MTTTPAIVAVGASITTGAASANVAIPNTNAGTKPRAIRIAVTAAAHVRIGIGAGTAATTNDTLVAPGDAITIAVPGGITHIAAIQNTAAGTVQISPLEGV